MFHQILSPVGGNLALSFVVAAIPIAVVLLLLGVLRRPAWQASLGGVVTAFILAIAVWKLPPFLAADAFAAGATFGIWPVMWIAFNALILYNVAVRSGRFEAFRQWVVGSLPDDRRVVLIVLGFCFGALLEGIAGFGTPVAIVSALLIMLGFKAADAIVFTLIFDTAPVAFGALGVPVTTLGAVTGLPAATLGAMIGRQLPFIAFLLPFYAIALYGGLKSVKALWPVLAVAGGSFALGQFVASNYLGYELADVVSSLTSLACTVGFLKVWRPAPNSEYACASVPVDPAAKATPAWQGGIPWIVVTLVVILWTTFAVAKIGQIDIKWPGLHNAVFVTLYNAPYKAVWSFQPLATGTAILFSAILTAALVGVGAKSFFGAVVDAWRQIRLAVLTVALIVGLAYLMNYSGIAYTLGLGVSASGALFPMLSAFLGWLAVFLSGSDTSGNALFGNLQVIAARQLDLNPVLIAATNSSGGVMGKMISPQNISTGCSTTELKGQEGLIFGRTFKHSVILTLILGCLVMLQQHVFPGMIPKLP